MRRMRSCSPRSTVRLEHRVKKRQAACVGGGLASEMHNPARPTAASSPPSPALTPTLPAPFCCSSPPCRLPLAQDRGRSGRACGRRWTSWLRMRSRITTCVLCRAALSMACAWPAGGRLHPVGQGAAGCAGGCGARSSEQGRACCRGSSSACAPPPAGSGPEAEAPAQLCSGAGEGGGWGWVVMGVGRAPDGRRFLLPHARLHHGPTLARPPCLWEPSYTAGGESQGRHGGGGAAGGARG